MTSDGLGAMRRHDRPGEEVTPEMMILGAALGILMLGLMAWLI
jgi:hypothetical protein